MNLSTIVVVVGDDRDVPWVQGRQQRESSENSAPSRTIKGSLSAFRVKILRTAYLHKKLPSHPTRKGLFIGVDIVWL